MIFLACPPVYTLPGTWSDPDKIARCNDTLIPHFTFNPDFCAKFLKRCIINKKKYRNTDAFVLLEWMGEGETPISRMCVQPNICHSILIFVPNIWGP